MQEPVRGLAGWQRGSVLETHAYVVLPAVVVDRARLSGVVGVVLLAPGLRANLVLADEEFAVQGTWIDGEFAAAG
jgi:N-acetylglucosamine-6-phosphate deacetylase